MIKELKYLFFLLFIFFFILLTTKYYFSDENIKKTYRSLKNLDTKTQKFIDTLQVIESDTENIIEYVENTKNKNKKKYKFWDLLINNEK
jgi:hypothetical protein